MTETNTTRPTVERLLWIASSNTLTGDETLQLLAEHGYVIVHPDEVPERGDPDPRREDWEDGWEVGWNACRAHIFREEQ